MADAIEQIQQQPDKLASLLNTHDRIPARLRRLKNELAEARREQVALWNQLKKEEDDVNKLEYFTVTSLFYSVFKNRDRQLDIEQQEYVAAALRYNACCDLIEAHEYEVLSERKTGAQESDCNIARGKRTTHPDRPMKAPLLCLIAICLSFVAARGQVLSGTVTDSAGTPLPYATIFVPELKKGTATNEEGVFEIPLPAQRHTVIFQYLGYRTQEVQINLRRGDQVMDIALVTEPVKLQSVTVEADREDPAYTIMRKAIAKAKYHTQQLDSFKATVYIKGSGRLRGLPGLFRKKIEKALEEEGIDTATAFVTESVSELTYRRPNQYTEKVISVRTVGDDNNTSPVGFIQGSFYEPEVNGSVSPLSPRAFAYYKFEYLGDFTDGGHTINKIRVIPRSRGDNVFEGTLYIVDQHWSIHSLDLSTYIWGILFNINQIYKPLEENVWLPVNNIFNVTGSFFGFRFEYLYFANMSDYEITLNPDLEIYVDVIDDKLQPEAAREADADLSAGDVDSTLEQLSSGEEVSRKKLRKLLKEYEKQEVEEWEQDTLKDVVRVSEHSIDSMAYTRDSMYWEEVRPLPLTNYEVRGYRVMDSIARVEKAEQEAKDDTVVVTVGSDSDVRVRSKSKFQIQDILLGGSYKIGEKSRFALLSPLRNVAFNTVDGYNFEWGVRLSRDGKTDWSVSPLMRYGFSRKKVNYQLVNRLSGGPRYRKWAVVLEGGKYPFQLNPDEPIHPVINSFMSLLAKRNYLKLYEKDYALAGLQKDFSAKLRLSLSVEWSRNRQLFNHSDFTIFGSDDRSYSPNAPLNLEIGDTAFPQYQALTTDLQLRLRPWLKFRIRNGRKSIVENSSPTFSFHLRSALDILSETESDYSIAEIGVKHDFRFPAGGVLNLHVSGGAFLRDEMVHFPEFRHFMGNRTPFATTDPATSFRMLDYYTYSTKEEFLTVFAHYQFRKLLATQLLEVRLLGIRENVFVNLLETVESDHYFELGYGLNYIFRIFRLELVTSWQDFTYQDFGVRIGIATNLDNLF